jgi:DNA-binding transcriptional LysR family regulator
MFHLRYFVAVAEELNFSAAARRLHMATSPLSQRIRDLEKELGHRLFERDSHSVTLTPAGEVLLPLARDVLEQINAMPWRLHEATRPGRRSMAVGIATGLHPRLRELLNVLAERVEDRWELLRRPGTSKDLIPAVSENRLAFALARLPVSDPSLDVLRVMSERLGVVVPADRFAGRNSLALQDLADLCFVVAPDEVRSPYFDQLDREIFERGIRKRIKLTGVGYGGIAETVSSGWLSSLPSSTRTVFFPAALPVLFCFGRVPEGFRLARCRPSAGGGSCGSVRRCAAGRPSGR